MVNRPYTIRIFVPDGDPEGVRVIDRMNWTGHGITFPRDKWQQTKLRPEFSRPGVYILDGYSTTQDDDLPTIYIGEGDVLRDRLDQHIVKKDFWDRAIVFTASNNSLNKAHVQWLEYALVKRAQAAKRSHLDNANTPGAPGLSEAELADVEAFLVEILQILPLVGLRAFEDIKPVAVPAAQPPTAPAAPTALPAIAPPSTLDTIVVPAQQEGFDRVFLGENCWYAIRISGGMLSNIKYIAAYRTKPESRITHYAKVARIEPYGEDGKYKVVFASPAVAIGPIPFGDAPMGAMQGSRYTTFAKLQNAQKLTDLF